ncbi:MAG: rod shape-determining protein MreC [Candidatus Nealsonbacteria bacterium]
MRFLDKEQFQIFNKKNRKFFPQSKLHSQRLKVGIIIFIIISLFLFNLSPFSERIKNFFYSLSEPVQKWLWEKGGGISDFFEMILRMKRLEQENEKLKLENQELIIKNINLEQLRRDNEILLTALNLNLQEEFKLIISQVIGKEIDGDYLIIDKGSEDGIAFGFPVITQQKSLVGKVIQVYESTSKIQLLTSKDNSFDVEIFEKEIYGLAEGKGNFNLLLELIPREKEINLTDKIITTTLGGNFPEGLLVGEIKKVKKSDVASFQEAEIQPAFDIREIDYLFLITNFTQ